MKPIFTFAELSSKSTLAYTTLMLLFFLTACEYKTQTHEQKPAMRRDTMHRVSTTTICQAPAKRHNNKKKKIYLTFDDGPNKGTPTVLDIMKQEQIPATFFLVGMHAVGSQEQMELMDSLRAWSHIELCNHSYSHAHNHFDRFYENPDSVLADFDKAGQVLQLPCKIGRTPGRNIWRIDSLKATDLAASKAAADTLERNGYKLVGWDMEWHFEPGSMLLTKNASELLQQIDSVFAKNRVKREDHLVILAHDQAYRNPSNIEELHKLVRVLKNDEKYELQLISAYPGISAN